MGGGRRMRSLVQKQSFEFFVCVILSLSISFFLLRTNGQLGKRFNPIVSIFSKVNHCLGKLGLYLCLPTIFADF